MMLTERRAQNMRSKQMKSSEIYKGTFTIINDRGLHTRPSTEIVKCASSFLCDITLRYKSTDVNARSLLGILMLAAERGAKIQIKAVGVDAKEAVEKLIELAEHQFHIKY